METIIKLLLSFKILSILIGLVLSILIIMYLYRSNLISPIIETLKDIIKFYKGGN